MRIKEKGSKLQLLRVAYSKEKGRSVETMFASLDKYAMSIPEELRKVLAADELKQLEEEIKRRQEGDELDTKKRSLKYTVGSLANFRRALEALGEPGMEGAFSPELANAMWAELDATRTALRKAGYAKPKPEAAQGE